jgi:hypothetical protein
MIHDSDDSWLSRHEILKAVAEYDRLGQDRFLEKYGFVRLARTGW